MVELSDQKALRVLMRAGASNSIGLQLELIGIHAEIKKIPILTVEKVFSNTAA